MRIDAKGWYDSLDHGQLCQVIEAQILWSETTCRILLPGRGSAVRKIPESVLQENPELLMWYDQALTRMGEET